MMCLGWDWDPQTRKYGDRRTIDGTWPPGIPEKFSSLVKRVIREAHAHVKEELRVSRAEEILPSMSPDLCIANFYTTTGQLGLHQNRDESRKSLREGLPVVSISIADSADFLYGDERDIAKAENVVWNQEIC
ncbi:alpha-ketoglutarate-dependent dioxygenase abh1-like [Pyrus ussuriensis x Pyrus communis]|uniref:Alpha-ketoglutarate-dependent dioxygenase abh1-like n=1 Tax=Pyrus ussuriensis x Pyrus communis TaxID=2448454 RepID=A0A5N5HFD0_9ROSA|nr:alpha-ketoglutarate-dependent dioxygenase abh1-like [Pyrus ussuriensis x Pyrus communis]